MQSWDEERDFRELVEADAEISSRLDPAAMTAVFDLQSTVQHVTVVFERLRALVSREAVVHA
jgi:adenylosuccinate lyase